MKKLLINLIHAYQLFISPLFPSSYRDNPTCSQYVKICGPVK